MTYVLIRIDQTPIQILALLILVRVSQHFTSNKSPACNFKMNKSTKTNLLDFLAISKYNSLYFIIKCWQITCNPHAHVFTIFGNRVDKLLGAWNIDLAAQFYCIIKYYSFFTKLKKWGTYRSITISYYICSWIQQLTPLNFKLHSKPQDRKNHLNILIIKHQTWTVNVNNCNTITLVSK